MLEIRIGDRVVRGASRKLGESGLLIRGAPSSASERGLFVKPDGFQGWGALPASRRDALTRAVQHGEHDVPTYLPARIVTIDGWILADSSRDLAEQIDEITGIGATGDRLQFVVDNLGQTRYAPGRRIVADASDKGSRRYLGEFQIQMVFADPRRFAPIEDEAVTGTTVTVVQRGNFPALPVIEISNAPSTWSVTSPAGTFTVSGAPSGGTHRLDMATGRVTRDGVYLPGVGSGPLWAVPNGVPWTHTLSAPGRVICPPTFV